MIGRFVKNVFATIGCLVFLGGVALFGWMFQEPLRRAYDAFIGRVDARGNLVDEGPGHPSPQALRTARIKEASMLRADGPDSVTMSASEIASLVRAGFQPEVVAAFDSMTITLDTNRLEVRGQLMTDVWGRAALGMLGGLLLPREPLRAAGPAAVQRPGYVTWDPRELAFRDIQIPEPAIGPIVNTLTGGSGGDIWIPVPATIRRMRIGPRGITFYRRER